MYATSPALLVSLSERSAWEQAWLKKITPWDNTDVQPALKELVEETWSKTGVDFESLVDTGKGRALVAGCGRVSFWSLRGSCCLWNSRCL